MISSEQNPKDALPISIGFAFSVLIHGVLFLLAPLLMLSDRDAIGTADSDVILSVKLVADDSDEFLEQIQESAAHKTAPIAKEQLADPTTITAPERRSTPRRMKQKFSEDSRSEPVSHSLSGAVEPSATIQKPDEMHPTVQMHSSEQTPLPQSSVRGFFEPQVHEQFSASRSSSVRARPTASISRRDRHIPEPVVPVVKSSVPENVSRPMHEHSPKPVETADSLRKRSVTKPVEVIVQSEPAETITEESISSVRSRPTSARSRGDFVPARPKGKNPRPSYPESAKRRRLEGKVILAVAVSAEGKVESVTVRQPSNWRMLDRAAAGAVSKWRFLPASRSGSSVSSVVFLPVVFQLDSDSKPRTRS